MAFRKMLYSLIIRPTKKIIVQANYHLGAYKKAVWLIGDGRSGTTWVSDLINFKNRYRDMFEPFHPMMIDSANFFIPHYYLRPDDQDPKMEAFAADIFSGKFTHPRVDDANRLHLFKGVIVKDIFANLFSYWMSRHFPQIKVILLIRNPFAVALSKYKLIKWFWPSEPLDLWNQRSLQEDFLMPYEDLIKKTSREGDFIAKQLLIWSIINYVPLRQFTPGSILPVFYESVYNDPIRELSTIYRYIDPDNNHQHTMPGHRAINRLSSVAGIHSTLTHNKSPLTAWKNELMPAQIDNGLTILSHFGLAELYDDKSNPDHTILAALHDPVTMKELQ